MAQQAFILKSTVGLKRGCRYVNGVLPYCPSRFEYIVRDLMALDHVPRKRVLWGAMA